MHLAPKIAFRLSKSLYFVECFYQILDFLYPEVQRIGLVELRRQIQKKAVRMSNISLNLFRIVPEQHGEKTIKNDGEVYDSTWKLQEGCLVLVRYG